MERASDTKWCHTARTYDILRRAQFRKLGKVYKQTFGRDFAGRSWPFLTARYCNNDLAQLTE